MIPAATSQLPEPPGFDDDLVQKCRDSRDFRPILFEWYKYVSILSNTAACIAPESPAFRDVPPVYFAVLIGLLNRCSRLMLSNTALSSTGRFGETTRLVDRCIAESAIKIQWLCHKDNDDSFRRFLADGLKKDLELRRHIEENIAARNGDVLVIESRMLGSIQDKISQAGLTDEDVIDAKRLPDLYAMCRDIQLSDLAYTGLQRMGSHAVHGTWSDLVFNYLREENGRLVPRDHEIETQDVQFIIVSRLVLAAISDFLMYMAPDANDVAEFSSRIDHVDQRLEEIYQFAWEPDFKQT